MVEQERSAEDRVLLGQEGEEVREEPGKGLLPVEEEEEVGQHREVPAAEELAQEAQVGELQERPGLGPQGVHFPLNVADEVGGAQGIVLQQQEVL